MKKRRGILRRIGSALILLILLAVSVLLIVHRDRLSIDYLRRTWNYRHLGTEQQTDVFHFSNYTNNTFALLGDGVAVASVGGLEVYDRAGRLQYNAVFSMQQPMIQTGGGRVLAYDLGGTALHIGSRWESLRHDDWDGAIIDARLNENGWLVVSAEQAGTRGVATVINPDGGHVFRVRIGTGYLLGAALAADNRTLAVLSMTNAGGRVAWYAIDSPAGDPFAYYRRDEEILFEFAFTDRTGNVMAISDSGLLFLSTAGELMQEYRFPYEYLQAFVLNGADAALYLTRYPLSDSGRLILLSDSADTQSIDLQGELFDIARNGRYTAVLFLDRILLFRNAAEYAVWEGIGGTTLAIRDDGALLRLSPDRAELLLP